jgi:2-polyprenyl-6-hydroxyphenyl methylase/3-demethylubiquinone-9 3-methyltransferase
MIWEKHPVAKQLFRKHFVSSSSFVDKMTYAINDQAVDSQEICEPLELRPNDYRYFTDQPAHTQSYLWPAVLSELRRDQIHRAFDLGCGNGALARFLEPCGIDVCGVDPSESGIAIARQTDNSLRLEIGSAYDNLRARFGLYPAVISLEVIEHVYYPRIFAKCVADLLQPGGVALVSTPYHGYLKNLALAISGRMDSHFTALWEYGHIKFWSIKTLTQLFNEVGMQVERIYRLGRFPTLAKSMLAVIRRPS